MHTLLHTHIHKHLHTLMLLETRMWKNVLQQRMFPNLASSMSGSLFVAGGVEGHDRCRKVKTNTPVCIVGLELGLWAHHVPSRTCAYVHVLLWYCRSQTQAD